MVVGVDSSATGIRTGSQSKSIKSKVVNVFSTTQFLQQVNCNSHTAEPES